MCRTTVHSGSISLGVSCSVSDKVMAAEDVLGVPYSHCPLKKRPVLIIYQDINESQDAGGGECAVPENLSMKPEDLRVKCKTLTSTLPPTETTVPASNTTPTEDRLKPKTSATLLRRYLQSCPLSPQTFEHKTVENSVEPINTGKPLSWPQHNSQTMPHRPSPQYPIRLYQCLSSAEAYSVYQHLSPPPENSDNDGQAHAYGKEALDLQKCAWPKSPVNHCKLLPSYPTYRSVVVGTPSPPLTPEDLSSPGSVASSGCCSTGSTGYRDTSNDVSQKQRYQCSLCLKFYCTYSGLTKHQRSHSGDNTDSLNKKSFGCKYCEKVYVSLGALKMHIRTHTLPCKCVICGKAFSRPWLLQGHIRTHTGEKPFSCPLCERAFADRSNLRAHLQTHSEVKKYSCSNCGKTFSRMSLATKHQDGGCSGLELLSEGIPFQN